MVADAAGCLPHTPGFAALRRGERAIVCVAADAADAVWRAIHCVLLAG
ncbi:MAG: hypothetical protein IKD10_03155 [Lentisphaeria bacterium]|nr:hypothetical protein [Lentisphaeria bacterium]